MILKIEEVTTPASDHEISSRLTHAQYIVCTGQARAYDFSYYLFHRKIRYPKKKRVRKI